MEKFTEEIRYIDIPYEEVYGIIFNNYQNHINGEIYNNGINDFDINKITKNIKEKGYECICFYCDKSMILEIKRIALILKDFDKNLRIGLFTNNNSLPFQAGVYTYIKIGEFDKSIYDLDSKQTLYKNISVKDEYNNSKFQKINYLLREAFNPIEENYFEMHEQLEKEMKIN